MFYLPSTRMSALLVPVQRIGGMVVRDDENDHCDDNGLMLTKEAAGGEHTGRLFCLMVIARRHLLRVEHAGKAKRRRRVRRGASLISSSSLQPPPPLVLLFLFITLFILSCCSPCCYAQENSARSIFSLFDGGEGGLFGGAKAKHARDQSSTASSFSSAARDYECGGRRRRRFFHFFSGGTSAADASDVPSRKQGGEFRRVPMLLLLNASCVVLLAAFFLGRDGENGKRKTISSHFSPECNGEFHTHYLVKNPHRRNYLSKRRRSSLLKHGGPLRPESSDEEDEVATANGNRKGKNEPIKSFEVEFEDIKMTLKQKKGKVERVILDGSISGVAKPGRMLAVMGPSGSGKTTFLHALAGRINENRRITLSGRRFVNEIPLSENEMIPSAFIEQDVDFFPHMTVKETLDFRVALKMGKKLCLEDRNLLVQELMALLSLSKSANTIVGNVKVRGISGGERKRLSIACEMIDSPPVIFLDEPTSGLDSYQAGQVVQTMRTLADKGKTVVAVIHQPSQRIFSLFDDLLLLSEGGRMMYFGEVEKVRKYFKDINYDCADEVGTAEHILDLVSPSVGNTGSVEKRLNRIARKAINKAQHVKAAKIESKAAQKMHKTISRYNVQAHGRPAASILQQFKLLLNRSVQETFRGKGVILLKLVQQLTIAIVYGGIYSLGTNQASIMDRFGLLSLITIGTANMAVAGTIRSFPKEKAIVRGEMTSKLYRTLPYFIAKAISEIPLIGFFSAVFGSVIYPMVGLQRSKFGTFLGLTSLHAIASEAVGLFLGAVSANSDVALALFPPVIVLSIIFDGRNISKESTPKLLSWLPKVGLIRWGYEGLSINEFDGLEFETGGPRRGPVIKTGKEALERFGIGSDTTLTTVVRAEVILISACWFLSFLGLSLTKEKFEVMRKPKKNNDDDNRNGGH